MTKANLKNILTAVRDIINRSRIAYKDYLGEETVTETKVLVGGTLSEQGTLTLKDPSFTGFVVGEGYEVTIDDTTQTLTAISDNGAIIVANITDFDNPGENYFGVGINPRNGQPICKAGGTYIGKTISISQTKTTTTKKYDIKKVPQELIPDTIARSADVAKVKTKADDAFNKADSAQSTANAAQTAANGAAKKVDPVFTGTFSQNRKENTVIGSYSHAEGDRTTASGDYSHAEGCNTIASGNSSHSEGYYTTASGYYSHAEGYSTTASGYSSHSEGNSTIASGSSSHVQGKYNIEDLSNTYAHIVGNGSNKARSNAHTIDWSGNAWFAGTVEGTALIIPSSTEGSTKKFKITVDDTGTLSATEVTA